MDRRFPGIGFGGTFRHGFALRFAARDNDLARHRDIALLVQMSVEGLHHAFECACFSQAVAEVADRGLNCKNQRILVNFLAMRS